MEQAFDSGNYIALIDDIKANPRLYGETNAFLYNMDIGVLYHYAGFYDSSNVYLMRAADIYDELFTRSVTNEAAALLTNDNVRPYRSKPYELVMLHQLAALNFMALGKFQESLVETRKVQIHFNEWERTRANGNRYHTDGMSHLFSSLGYEAVDEPDNSLISLFKSVHAYNLGPVRLPPEVGGFAYNRLRAGDREDDVRRLDLSSVDALNGWTAEMGETEIIIVAYAGKGPNLREQNWSGTFVSGGNLHITLPSRDPQRGPAYFIIPAPLVPAQYNAEPGQTFHVKISLPELQTFPSRTSHFSARLDDDVSNVFESVAVNDFNLQAQKALDDAFGEIIARTALRVVIRTITSQQAKSRLSSSNPNANLLLSVGMDVAAGQLEKADVRMCFFLPRQVHVIRFPVTPGTHSLALNVHDSRGGVIGKKRFDNIEVRQGEKRVLFHNSLR
jgi:hypothetical protein